MNEQALKDAILAAGKELANKHDWTVRDDGDYGTIDEQTASQFVGVVYKHVSEAINQTKEK